MFEVLIYGNYMGKIPFVEGSVVLSKPSSKDPQSIIPFGNE
jgi:hypothetical protein